MTAFAFLGRKVVLKTRPKTKFRKRKFTREKTKKIQKTVAFLDIGQAFLILHSTSSLLLFFCMCFPSLPPACF